MGDSGLTYLGAFEILTEGLIEHADAYQEPDGRIRAVRAAGNQVCSIQCQRPAGAGIYGAVYALGTTAGIRYVSRPVSRATFDGWVEAAAQLRASADESARERSDVERGERTATAARPMLRAYCRDCRGTRGVQLDNGHPYCAGCGSEVLCDECGYPVDRFGVCLRRAETGEVTDH